MLNRDELIKADGEWPRVEVPIPCLGGSVLVRTLSTAEVEKLGESNENIRARFAALAVVNESGERLFGDDDLAVLSKLPYVVLNPIWEAGAKLNGLAAEDEAKN